MAPDAYIAAIEHAVMNMDEEMVESIALRLCDSAEAMQILLANGYGTIGMPLSELVRLVPKATKGGK